MPNTSAPILAAVPDDGTYQKINRLIDWPGILKTAIEELKTQRVAARTALTNALTVASPNVEDAIKAEQAWEITDKGFAAKIKAAEDLKEIFENQIEDLKTTQPPELLRTVLQTKIDELEAEVRVEHEQTELARERIKFLRSLLRDVNASVKKPA